MDESSVFFTYHEVDFKIENEEAIGKWLSMVVDKEKGVSGRIEVIFCTDKFLLEKNVKYLETNTLTDIITFDYCEGKTISGDLFISIERVRENARIYGVSELNEANRVMVHGVLHLVGYNDHNTSEKVEMREKEDYYLSLHPFL